MIYLASPYSDPDEKVRIDRYNKISDITVRMLFKGIDVFCPIAYSHPLAHDFGLDGSWAFWQKLDKAFLDICDEMWIATLPGWASSVGVTAEARYAIDINVPILYLHPETLDITKVPSYGR